MANVAVTNTFTTGTIVASEVNTNFTDITTWLNNRNAGSDTWAYLKVSATDAAPVDFSSSGATTEVSINNSATDGDPLLTFKLSGATKFTMGIDDGDSDIFKIGTTGLATNVALSIPAAGSAVYFADGSAGSPSISFASDPDTGVFRNGANDIRIATNGAQRLAIDASAIATYNPVQLVDGSAAAPALTFNSDLDTGLYRSGANTIDFATAGTKALEIADNQRVLFVDGDVGNPSITFMSDADTGFFRLGSNAIGISLGGANFAGFYGSGVGSSFQPGADNTYTCGTASFRWSDVRSVKINGADYGFMNGYILREYPCTAEDVQTKDSDWFKTNANLGIQILNDIGEIVCVIGRDGTLYANSFQPLSALEG